jgi:hypothetical protein
VAALSGKSSFNAIQFQGQVQGHSVSILIDSGSSHTFVCRSFAAKLSGQSPLSQPLTVKIADGQFIQCDSEILQLNWSVQGCDFQSDAKILSLAHFDIIVGMDWLARFSPMQVDWHEKWLLIPYNGSFQLLHGEFQSLPPGSVIQIQALLPDATKSEAPTYPPEFTVLLQEFQSVFLPPQGYLPPRDCEHSIPLLPGAAPVNIRPYRYPPAIKDEIERQISEMLATGMIQHSNSPFSSSVLLVKKKDGMFRFCVDFRHLNAITAKTKYPVPVIEELLDELHGAAWFSCLDLTAGYHQIRLAVGEISNSLWSLRILRYGFRSFGRPNNLSQGDEHDITASFAQVCTRFL